MAHLALQLDRQAWRNRLPEWILRDEAYQRLIRSRRRTLQTIADRCDRADDQGNLLGAYGGQPLARDAGVCTKTLFEHVRYLETVGYVVTLKRGGTIGDRNYANIYGIPGAPGALDLRRAKRRMITMDQGDDGRYRPTIIQPGDQVSFWPTIRSTAPGIGPARTHPRGPAQLPRAEQVPNQKLHGGTVKLHGGGTVKLHTTITPSDGTPIKNHGVQSPKSGQKKAGGGGLGHVENADLANTAKMLALFERAANAGLLVRSEHSLIQFVAAAEHARRVGTANPAGLFASTVRNGRWLYITHDDEDAAAARLREHRMGKADRRTPPALATESEPVAAKPAVSDLAKLAAAAIKLAGSRSGYDAFYLVKQQKPSLTREQFDAAVVELEARR